MTTAWTVPFRPTATLMTARTKPGDFVYYTWDTCPDTWNTATYTWDTAGIGIALTSWTGRIIP